MRLVQPFAAQAAPLPSYGGETFLQIEENHVAHLNRHRVLNHLGGIAIRSTDC
jgi:hypothetical protein